MFWETSPKCKCSYLIFPKYAERASLNTAAKLMAFSLLLVVVILLLLMQLPLPRKIIYKPTQLELDIDIILSLFLINGVWAKWYSKNTLQHCKFYSHIAFSMGDYLILECKTWFNITPHPHPLIPITLFDHPLLTKLLPEGSRNSLMLISTPGLTLEPCPNDEASASDSWENQPQTAGKLKPRKQPPLNQQTPKVRAQSMLYVNIKADALGCLSLRSKQLNRASNLYKTINVIKQNMRWSQCCAIWWWMALAASGAP